MAVAGHGRRRQSWTPILELHARCGSYVIVANFNTILEPRLTNILGLCIRNGVRFHSNIRVGQIARIPKLRRWITLYLDFVQWFSKRLDGTLRRKALAHRLGSSERVPPDVERARVPCRHFRHDYDVLVWGILIDLIVWIWKRYLFTAWFSFRPTTAPTVGQSRERELLNQSRWCFVLRRNLHWWWR